MRKQKKQNVLITLLMFVWERMMPYILVVGLVLFIPLSMLLSIPYSIKKSGAYERYDAMVAELSAIPLPEKTILESTQKGVRSSWIYSTRSYRTNFLYYKLRPYYQQQFKLKGWTELGTRDDSSENEEAITYRFRKKGWKLKLMTFKGKKGKPNPYTPWSYTYMLRAEWKR